MLGNSMLFYVAVAVVVIAIIVGIVFSVRRNMAIKKNGIEADAVVSRIKETESTDGDGNIDTTYTYYVRFQTQDGNFVEAKLGNAPRFTREGESVRIKYLPEKPNYVILVK